MPPTRDEKLTALLDHWLNKVVAAEGKATIRLGPLSLDALDAIHTYVESRVKEAYAQGANSAAFPEKRGHWRVGSVDINMESS